MSQLELNKHQSSLLAVPLARRFVCCQASALVSLEGCSWSNFGGQRCRFGFERTGHDAAGRTIRDCNIGSFVELLEVRDTLRKPPYGLCIVELCRSRSSAERSLVADFRRYVPIASDKPSRCVNV